MTKYKRDHGDGGGDDNSGGSDSGSGSSTSSTSSRSSQSTVTTVTTTSTQTATPTPTITTFVTSVDRSGGAPNTGHGSSSPTGGGITPQPQSHLSSQVPSGSAPSNSNPTTVTVPSSSTPRPVFLFNNLANATLCNSFGLSWTYSGQHSVAMTLTVQQSLPQSDPKVTSSGSPSGSPATMRILTTDVQSNADSFIWTSVDVMEGWYIAKAFDTSALLGISAGSTPFFVTQGSDTSCLFKQPTPTIATPPPPSQTTSSSSSVSRPSIGTGDIVGITLGVTAGAICLLLALFTLPRLRRDSPSTVISNTKSRRPYLLY